MKRIVIAGGGFVGLRVARLLAKRLAGSAHVILIDRQERFVFSPWLVDGLAGEMESDQYSEPYETAAKRGGFAFIRAEVKAIDRHAKVADVTKPDGSHEAVGYDVLVVCPGARPAYYGIEGAEQATRPFKTMAHVTELHEQLRELIHQARTATGEERKKLLHLMVIGGGPTGIETVFAMKTYLECHACSEAPALAKELRFTLIEGSPNLLNGFRPSISAGALRELERQGIEVKTSMRAKSISQGRITTESETLSGGLILWCGGVQPNDVSFTPDVSRDPKNTLKADQALGLGQDIFGGGDAVICLGANGKPAARTAQIAMLEAEALAANVVRYLKGQPLKPCYPALKGSLITLGDTGFIDTPWFAIKTKLTIPFRRWFYRFRFFQMTGR
ncbi:FAD-dependent oxidoreductase [Patescibacteria group bacterium]|jgi:NADH dehydrogenase|nr:FAD-dependent oxidoreductase [Patescibacteria group bacterium]